MVRLYIKIIVTTEQIKKSTGKRKQVISINVSKSTTESVALIYQS